MQKIKIHSEKFMNLFISLIILITIDAIASDDTFKIYDKADLLTKPYFSEIFGDTIYAKSIRLKRPSKDESKLITKAKTANCNSKHKNLIEQWIENEEKDKSKGQRFHEITDFDSLSFISCSIVEKSGYDAYAFNFKLHEHDPKSKLKNFIWVGLITSKKIIKTGYADIGVDGEGEYVKKLLPHSIVDIDNDERHEIIIEDIRYAGKSYKIIHFSTNQILVKDVHVDSWD